MAEGLILPPCDSFPGDLVAYRAEVQSEAFQPTSTRFDLVGRSVHIWHTRALDSHSVAEMCEPLLGSTERSYAERFRFDPLRHGFMVNRAVLRTLLGFYLKTPPAEIEFTYGLQGKPRLAAASGMSFNASRSGDLAVFAFTLGCELGVDVEQIRHLPDMHSIAERFFCPEEKAELMALRSNQRESAFYLCWTRKEAFVKAIGVGLSDQLSQFRVTLQPGKPALLVHSAVDSGSHDWTLHDLALAPAHAGALAYAGAERPVIVWPRVDPVELLTFGSGL